MDQQNMMMDFVWLLNAADNSAFELRELYSGFLGRRQACAEMRQSIAPGTEQSAYLEREISRYVENLQDLRKTLGEVIDALR